ncbi:hypothetical protein LPJ61_006664 [Coemansia biformis]|uniref:Uncharacterized protein n=1 Tax=Coemansia biformis TaxID=1286918 RepID=A0A9W8CMF5_9FUNG|nr:hypothetical protein LPJ61_006664 [Coemansia biformis]
MRQKAKDFIIEQYNNDDYASVYASNPSGNLVDGMDNEDDENEANAYVMYVNLRTASGNPVLTRVTSFKCDNCVIYINMAFPEAPISHQRELQVQMLDGAMKRMNVTRDNDRRLAARRKEATERGGHVPLYYARSRQIKAALVLENPDTASIEAMEAGRRLTGPLVVFVTGSISRLIDADSSDVMRIPFFKLVAPEDLLHVSKFFERLASSTDVLFENFSLLSRPHLIDGDIVVADEQNQRIVVECLGAAVPDGVALMLRKLRTSPAPKRDTIGNYIHSRVHQVDEEEGGYMSLSELISSDPDTSDAPDAWSVLR